MGQPLAYLLTWTTRGAWLHGDPRGSVDLEHNAWQRPRLAEDHWRAAGEYAQVGGHVVSLSPAARRIVAEVLGEVCVHRGWKLLAENVRKMHTHVVVAAPDYEPERVLQQFKAWSTRRLRAGGLASSADPVWTRHGSTRYLWNADDIGAAVDYVLNEQDNPRRFGSEPRA